MVQTRIALYYASFFGANGVFLPFWPVWLASRGLSATDIGILFACTSVARILVTPMIAQIADRRGSRKSVIATLAVISFVAYCFYYVSYGLVPILLVALVGATTWSGGQPLAESLTVAAARERGFEYGRVRLWGSIAFIVVAAAAGKLLDGRDADVIFFVGLAMVAALVAAALMLPNYRVPPATGSGFPFAQVFKIPGFAVFLFAAGCAQSSHGVYYAFSTLDWRAGGLDDTVIGLLWAEGVIAEIVLFAAAARVMRRLGPEQLILLGGLAGLLRWSVLAVTDWLPILIVVQVLHAFTFGAAHLGAIHFMARAVPQQLSATAQSIYAAAVMGIATGGSMFLAGLLYDSFAGHAYFAMAILGAIGAACALAMPRVTGYGGEPNAR